MGDLLPNQIKMEILDPKDYQVVNGQLITNNHSATNSTLNEDEPPCRIISQFDTESDLSLMQSLQVQNESLDNEFAEVSRGSGLNEEMINDVDNTVLIQHMDIRTCLSQLREMLEKRIGTDLTDYEFWLQDSKMLESHKTLVDQCIRGEGIVQVNLQLKPLLKRINIMDVLKPDEEFLGAEDITYCDERGLDEDVSIDSIPIDIQKQNGDIINNNDSSSKKQLKMVRWAVDARFKADQVRLNIPEDPHFWTIPQVKYWIQWAVRQFNLTGIKLSDWTISGSELCNLNVEEFKAKCPSDPIDLFWTHLELLRKCKFIAVVQSDESDENMEQEESTFSAIKKKPKQPSLLDNSNGVPIYISANHRSGNNGQIQLWQFLLELLTSTEHTNVIQWIGGNGEFKLQDPEIVAKLWGQRKHKPTMNYEKLSRALRYYYDGDMIAKVHNKRFVYRFVCDLKQLIGYDASDLSRLVNSGSMSPTNSNTSKQSEMFFYS